MKTKQTCSSASRFSSKEAYKFFIKKNPKSTVTYSLYKHIVSEFNKKLSLLLLEGVVFNMGHRLGTVRIKRIPRAFNKPAIDWGETNKLKKLGINKHVYFTDDYYYRWNWDKSKCKVRNKSVYSFAPTAGPTGNRKALVKKLKTDEFAHMNFKQ